ncbi:hypothetical protein HC028_02715 [Planosporangium flavigriseum]|uniref:PH domain-containing protein n=1 Tax=Planosporangium flavigriseum TaxID=373681 RepID=A0A8J3LRX2_9ACTN|nr:hypothetical protein [Planosporangium flavigriseum]NJC63427.1 hypothetical protein [Planosporangium flavigriseum]GIG76514.1 hypothetical protein Pfl04_49180 [Planosporangium flavigriseum]
MGRIVIRPRIQTPLLVVLFVVWALLGVMYFTNGEVLAKRDWFGITLGCVLVISGVAGMWRALRLGVVIDSDGMRIRGFDSRERVIPWSTVEAVQCEQVDQRAGLPLFAPVIRTCDDNEALPIRGLGSYSRSGAERRVQQLRNLMAGGAHS